MADHKSNALQVNPSSPENPVPGRKGIIKSSAVCPNGHKPPTVQYLKDDEVYCCTKCAVTWKGIFAIDVPAGMKTEDFVSLCESAPDLLRQRDELLELIVALRACESTNLPVREWAKKHGVDLGSATCGRVLDKAMDAAIRRATEGQ